MILRLAILGIFAILASCAAGPVAPPEQPAAAPFAGLWRDPAHPTVLGWVSPPWTFSTTSWAIVGTEGLVLIDTQFLAKDAIAFVEAAEAATGKKARLAVVLHANPDKFNGTAALQARGIRVITSTQVAALIPSVHEKRLAAFGARYAPDYPTVVPVPEAFGEKETVLSEAGVALTLTPVGAGCSAAHVIASFDDGDDRHVFAGDLIAQGSHAWLELGESTAWLARLDELSARHPTRVYPGRGLSGDSTLISDQRTYIESVKAAVKGAVDAGGSDDVVFGAARDGVLRAYPDLRFSIFLNIGLPAEIRKQKGA